MSGQFCSIMCCLVNAFIVSQYVIVLPVGVNLDNILDWSVVQFDNVLGIVVIVNIRAADVSH